jgi:hypothetical protein
VLVTQDIPGITQAARELMEESLRQEDMERVLENLLLQDADFATLAKAYPVRHLAEGYYEYATYILWMRGKLDAGLQMSIMADEADGLCAIEAARQQFDRDHPACPQCGKRQYSSTPIRCRSIRCGMEFGKKR